MDSTLLLAANDLSDEDLQKLTLELSKTLNDETEAKATIPEKPSQAGSKSDVVITLGTILLTALSSGTVAALFNVIKSYIERKPSLEFEFKRKDGQQLKIKAEQLNKDQIDQTIQMANDFIGE
ncbi:MAG: hypothetical protein KAR20_19435 [Candidatus Heimdallarchaeota archaeon]|nr:hypothetical protein [Candidatus Heimdallarchaeota archaeon]